MQAQDRLALGGGGQSHGDRPIEPAGAEQRGIEILLPVGGADHQHVLAGREAVHLHQELVQRAVVLVVALVAASATAQRIELVDEDHAAPLPGLAEELLDPGHAQADQEAGDLAAADDEEGNPRLAGDRAGHERLAGAGRAEHQHTLRGPRADALERLRLAEKLDQLAELGDGPLVAADVAEGGTRAPGRPDADLVPAAHLPPENEADDREGDRHQQHLAPEVGVDPTARLERDRRAGPLGPVEHRRDLEGGIDDTESAARGGPVHRPAPDPAQLGAGHDGDLPDGALVEAGEEGRVGDGRGSRRAGAPPARRQGGGGEQGNQAQRENPRSRREAPPRPPPANVVEHR